jgi:tol-pal system protein YbgF
VIRPGTARRLLPAVLLGTAGCFATRTDIQVLQNDLQVMRIEATQRDSARRLEVEQLLAAIRTLASVQDSLQALSVRTARFQGDVNGSIYSIDQQLLQIQELTGQSQRRLQELRAEMEQRNQQLSVPVAVTPVVDTGRGVAAAPAAPPATPGPNQLFQLALDQLRRGSTGTARTGFQDLLRQYPGADVAAAAQFYVAESFAQEGKGAMADSVYVVVVAKYPQSERAPTALYKHAAALLAAGKTVEGRTALEDVVRKYPRSDEAVLARDRLRALK